ncbi:MAG: hypothetical protein ACKVOJ_08845 [Sphingomonadaceae bacterium]
MTAVTSPSSKLYLAAAYFTAAAFVMTSAALLFDERLFYGVAIWDKPLKFWASISLHFGTLGLLLPLASSAAQNSWLTRTVTVTCVVAGLFETFYITAQAARGRPSHFTTASAFEVQMYQLMGVGAVLLVVASFVVGIQICRSGKPWTGFRLGAALGLIIGSVLTLFTAGFMSSQPSHYLGLALGAASDANGLPIVGWSLSLPDLRPPHFVATHLMQALPVVGLLVDKFADLHNKPLVFGSALIGVILVVGLFARAVTM